MSKDKKAEKSLDSVLEEFDVYFHECFGSKLPVAFVQDSGWKPLTDVYETGREFVIRIEIGGIAEGDIDLTWQASSLVIQGRRREPDQKEHRLYHKIEITTGSFERRIAVPRTVRVDRDSLRLEYRGGIMTIRLTKISDPGTGV